MRLPKCCRHFLHTINACFPRVAFPRVSPTIYVKHVYRQIVERPGIFGLEGETDGLPAGNMRSGATVLMLGDDVPGHKVYWLDMDDCIRIDDGRDTCGHGARQPPRECEDGSIIGDGSSVPFEAGQYRIYLPFDEDKTNVLWRKFDPITLEWEAPEGFGAYESDIWECDQPSNSWEKDGLWSTGTGWLIGNGDRLQTGLWGGFQENSVTVGSAQKSIPE